MKAIFKDLKVLELANVLAGPAVGMFFAELGAKVTKIENKTTGGDITRQWKLPKEGKESASSAYYASVNWGKNNLFMDLSVKADKEVVYKLVKGADIVISNYKYGDDKKLGMDYANLKKINPTIIYGHISGFGEKDLRTGFDVVLQAESGFMSMNGTSESGPIKMPVAMIDILTAHQLKEALLIALLQKSTSGKGAYVSVSLMSSAISSLANQASNWLMEAHVPTRIGSLHPTIAPYGEIFKSKDKKEIVLAIGTNKQFKNLCAVLGKSELSNDEKFKTNTLRVKNRIDLRNTIFPLIVKYKAVELMKLFSKKIFLQEELRI